MWKTEFFSIKGSGLLQENIWQAATGGFFIAAEPLAQRSGSLGFAPPVQTGETAQCLAAAQQIICQGVKPGEELDTLAPAFSYLDKTELKKAYPTVDPAQLPSPPVASETFGSSATEQEYQTVYGRLQGQFETAVQAKSYPLLAEACEDALSFAPVYPGDPANGDLSLYEYGKMLVMLASSFALQLQQQAGFFAEGSPAEKECLLLFSCDMSGIQKFIYTIATDSARKQLRGRSLFLELLMEHLIDELLERCGLTRANCIYNGGGHAYLLLPNLPDTVEAVNQFDETVNGWLMQQFGIRLHLASAVQACSPAALFGAQGKQAYSDVFEGVSYQLSHHKLHKFSAKQLQCINHTNLAPGDRECNVCGRPDRLVTENRCEWCERITGFSTKLASKEYQGKTVLFVVEQYSDDRQNKVYNALPLPALQGGRRYQLRLATAEDWGTKGANSSVRIYSENCSCPQIKNCSRLWLADWYNSTLFSEQVSQAQGIARLGVYRADVDNLGQTFVQGFSGGKVSLLRSAALSRSLSLFFKRYINEVFARVFTAPRVVSESEDEAQPDTISGVAIVYAGGDDLFLVGAWNETLKAARELAEQFGQYTGWALTISGGLGLYTVHYPIARAAEETAELVEFSKNRQDKNAFTLFADEEDLRFTWPTFEQKVIQEKLKKLETFFGMENQERGNSYLHRLLQLLVGAQDQLNLARCAYLLARFAPPEAQSETQKKEYREFLNSFYQWAICPEERKQLIAAIYLFLYSSRVKRSEGVNGGKL